MVFFMKFQVLLVFSLLVLNYYVCKYNECCKRINNNTHTSKQRVYVYHMLSVVVSATTYYCTTHSPTHSDRDRLCFACVCDICGATLVVG